jgi:hypothetical protein
MAQPEAEKICVICGEDCSQRRRIKDPKGRYYCKDCYDEAKRQRAESREVAPEYAPTAIEPREPAPEPEPDEGLGIMAELLEGDTSPCPSCGQALAAGTVICTNCGFNL